MYPRGDTFRGILELQLGAVVLKLMVFGRLKKEMGRREPYFCHEHFLKNLKKHGPEMFDPKKGWSEILWSAIFSPTFFGPEIPDPVFGSGISGSEMFVQKTVVSAN